METYLGKPALVRETSRVGVLTWTMHRFGCAANNVGKIFRDRASKTPSAAESWSQERDMSGRVKAVRAFQDVVLAPDLKEQVPLRVGL